MVSKRNELTCVAKNLIEVIEWWWGAWRWQLEKSGISSLSLNPRALIPWVGKGSGTIQWHSGNRYFPFKSEDALFGFLDIEYETRPSVPSIVTQQISLDALNDYFEHVKKAYIQKIGKPQPTALPSHLLRRELRSCHGPQADKFLINFAEEHYGACFALGYSESGSQRQWHRITIGIGMYGSNILQNITYQYGNIKGVAIGMVDDTSHVVVVVPNGGVFLVWDEDCEIGHSPDLDFTVGLVFDNVNRVGTKFRFDRVIDDDQFKIKSFAVGEVGAWSGCR
jgi:hypothetical protein